ncbi:hypothetical protein [Pinibacter aurantiacus]|uniref:Uncharacterized protein n=1 Tax=Pinibacter aurantiacus TaxID=2851599 RepID=A0A9E2SA32_9BACT|nr:hypothetical protein [Pinibacter aurantiacus]MBV4359226.1 hypothetical protein [Pinibacter aurantiacus]
MQKRFLAYLLFGIGVITVTFFRHYSGEIIPYPFLFWLSGFALFGIGVWLLRNTPSAAEENIQKRLAEAVSDLKENGEKIRIDLTECEVKEHNYIEEREKEKGPNDPLFLAIEQSIYSGNTGTGFDKPSFEQVQVKQTVIVFSRYNSRTGLTDKFVSRVIPKDKVSLSFYLDQQKHTFLYVDKSNPARYYFDLDFLVS